MTRAIRLLPLIVLTFPAMAVMSSRSQAQVSVGIGIHIGPPALPVYAQPVCPGMGYIWTPGYWAYGPAGYFWVPGTWVLAPTPGYLWTPGYWGWGGGGYFWHAGYWGPHVGFYGGINYGFGYVGTGFYGGEWRGGVYHYNTAVTNVNTTVINNTYNTTVVNNTTVNRTSYNGGTGGVVAQPTAAERAAENENHIAPTTVQTQHQQAASTNRAMLASENHGTPVVAATPKPGAFSGPGVVAARPAAATASNLSGANGTKAMAVQSDRPPSARTNGNSIATTPVNISSSTNHPNTTQTNATQTAQTNGDKPAKTQSSPAHTNTSKPANSHPNNKTKPQSHPSEPRGGLSR
jgi:WXXGXW repeat (2 copies)